MSGGIVRGYIVPGMPHPLLAAEQNEGWGRLRRGFDTVKAELAEFKPDLVMLYSTQWFSILGHQVQAHPEPKWTHVDYEWHELGEIPYQFKIDPEFAESYCTAAKARGLHARTVAYDGFPIDTGSVSTLKLLLPNNEVPASIVSCNMYADRGETLVLGKALNDAAVATGKRVAAVAVTMLSNRLHTDVVAPKDDRISSLKDDEWNRKILEFLGEGRLEDVSQLARQFYLEANADQKLKAIWWLAAAMGQHNNYDGNVLAYEPVMGAGGAVVSLAPSAQAAKGQEFDEEDVETYGGDRSVLDAGGQEPPRTESSGAETIDASSVGVQAQGNTPGVTQAAGSTMTDKAPSPVGAYPHARRIGDLLFLSGVGPRQPGTDEVPGGKVRDTSGKPLDYDVAAQTQAVIDNVRVILEAAGSSIEKVRDVSVYLIDMDRDFAAFNKVYAETFKEIGATRTTVEVRALPTPIAVEFKVIAEP